MLSTIKGWISGGVCTQNESAIIGGGENEPSIFVLRNNDLGDLLVVTPLFEALKRLFPKSKIIAGIGDWNRPILENNPFVDEIHATNAPWHNKRACRYAQNSFLGRLEVLRYLLFSDEVRRLRRRRPDIGIDVLGSLHGSLLFQRAGIRYRVATRGYHGRGYLMTRCVDFDPTCYVGRAALKFAEVLGLPTKQLPALRPQIYLTEAERLEARTRWAVNSMEGKKRLVIGMGGGYREKCWPLNCFRSVLESVSRSGKWSTILVGGPEDTKVADELATGLSGVESLAGTLSLRQTFAVTAESNGILTNSSMLMHVASAFEKACAVVLGPSLESAEAHAQLWSTREFTVIFGPDATCKDVASPDRVWNHLLSWLRK